MGVKGKLDREESNMFNVEHSVVQGCSLSFSVSQGTAPISHNVTIHLGALYTHLGFLGLTDG